MHEKIVISTNKRWGHFLLISGAQTHVKEFTSYFMNIMQFFHKTLPGKAPCASDLANQITCEAIPLQGSEGKWARFAPLHLEFSRAFETELSHYNLFSLRLGELLLSYNKK